MNDIELKQIEKAQDLAREWTVKQQD